MGIFEAVWEEGAESRIGVVWADQEEGSGDSSEENWDWVGAAGEVGSRQV